MSLTNKNILLGITGSIAAYKSAELVSRLRKAGANVRVVMTKNAQQFITATTMQTLSNNPVRTDMFAGGQSLNFKFSKSLEAQNSSIDPLEHIELARWADAIIIAPASANFIAHLAHGLADNLLLTLCLATKAKIAIAPAMNCEMWQNKITQKNISQLKKYEIEFLGPASGLQACGETGLGRMLEPEEILLKFDLLFNNDKLSGKKILITAGPTYEPIDPIKFIGNYSSGKMGFALARAAIKAGATVTLVNGPTSLTTPNNVKQIKVKTAQQMYAAVMQEINAADIFISTAAVADYQPSEIAMQKLKKTNDKLILKLKPTHDILASISNLPNHPLTIGFAAETENVVKNAREKLINKKLDMIVANQVGEGIGFGEDKIAATICKKNGDEIELPLNDKYQIAAQIINAISDLS
jgi:phosphopantothenoylcysteine decarboxylase/phosphopantothenate--cysteine ligase